jgi:serine/threonine protein kinase/thiol-disulfide isomerase/thioredoxin
MPTTWLTCSHCQVQFESDPTRADSNSTCPSCSRKGTLADHSVWFYARDRQKHGPIPLGQLRRLAVNGQLRPTDMVLKQGTSLWQPASAVEKLFPPQTAIVPAAVAVPAAAPPPDALSLSIAVPVAPVATPLTLPPMAEPISLALSDVSSAAAAQDSDGTALFAPGKPDGNRETAAGPQARTRSELPRPKLPGYDIIDELGRGGMGVVYRARQVKLNRLVALKMVLSGAHASARELARFRTEAEAVAQLQHTNIVQIYEVAEADGHPYFSLEYVDGGSLGQRLGGTPQPAAQAARVIETLARAMHFAHQRGVVHRDLKPANVLLSGEADTPLDQCVPKITDFGLAKQLGSEHGQTASGAIMGTPSYMAPEQALGQKREIGPAVDVYALGAILYECLTGRPPFRAETPLDTVFQVATEEPVPPSRCNLKVPLDLETICLKCLQKNPRKRYESAETLADDLRRFQTGEPILARPVTRWERAFKWARKRPAAAALIAVVCLSTFGLIVGSWSYSVRLRKALDDSEANLLKAQTQERLAKTNAERVSAGYQKRLDDLDSFITNLDGRLSSLPDVKSLRLEFLDDFRRLSERLLQENPNDPTARRHSALIHYRMGEVWQDWSGHAKESEASFRTALELQKGLVAEFPSDTRYRNELARTYSQQAVSLIAAKRKTDAQESYRQAIQLLDQLAAAPAGLDVLDLRIRATQNRFELANLIEEIGSPKDAEPLYRQTLQQQENFIAQDPKRAHSYYEIGLTANSLGLLLAPTNVPAAQEMLQRAIQAQRQATKLEPATSGYQVRLFEAYADLGQFYKQNGRHAELARMAADYGKDCSESSSDTYNTACYYANAIEALQANKKVGEAERKRLAEDYSKQAMKLLNEAVRRGWKDHVHMDRDADLAPLRERADYRKLVADLEQKHPAPPIKPVRELANLSSQFDDAEEAYQATITRARTTADRRKALAARPRFSDYAERFWKFAELYKDSAEAVRALAWILEHSTPERGETLPPETQKWRQHTLTVLERDHFPKREFAAVCEQIALAPRPEYDQLLKLTAEKHSQRNVRGVAWYALGKSLAKQAEDAEMRRSPDAAALANRAEKALEKVEKEYGAVELSKQKLGPAATARLYNLRHLAIGRVAPDIEGQDLDGKSFKLSDFRGKVVIVDFWANWCGWCRQMYPHERQMVERLRGRPFALLGINCDEDLGEVKRAVQREQLTWRSWWDGGAGGGRIQQQWQVRSYPTLFVLDHKGIIRFKNIRGEELEAAINQLVKEREAELGIGKR